MSTPATSDPVDRDPVNLGHTGLALALSYPGREEARAALVCFPEFAEFDPAGLEELYTRTFDINPVCSLETGWHLFGEDYNRGAFLVRMRGLLRQHGIEEGAELTDHLESALRVLSVMEPRSVRGRHESLRGGPVRG